MTWNTLIKFILFYFFLFAMVWAFTGCRASQEPGGPPIGFPGAPKN